MGHIEEDEDKGSSEVEMPYLPTTSDALTAAMDRIIARGEGRFAERAVRTGFGELDDALGGLEPGRLVVLASRPAAGSTTLALNICEHQVMSADGSVLYASLKEGRADILGRLLGLRAGVDYYRLQTGRGLTQEDITRLGRANNDLSHASFRVFDPPGATAATIAAAAERCSRDQGGLNLVVVDDLLAVEPDDARPDHHEQLARTCRRLRQLARAAHLPVLALARLGLNGESRPSPRGLIGSAAILGEADAVLLLHRPEYFDPDDQPGVAYVHVIRNAVGPTEIVHLEFCRRTLRFSTLR